MEHMLYQNHHQKRKANLYIIAAIVIILCWIATGCKKETLFIQGGKYYLNGNITYSELKQNGIQALPPFIAQSEYYSPIQGHGFVCFDSNVPSLRWEIPVSDLKSN
jgi:hypothetical protein